MGILTNLLQHPLTKGMDLDDPQTTELRRKIIKENPFLRKLYEEWYSTVCQQLPAIDGDILEVGTGAGFLIIYIPDLITSDIISIPGNHVVCDALNLPFQKNTLRAIVLINVLHHIRDPERFFKDAERCIKQGGKIITIEPWVSSWSSIIYARLHHEPFAPDCPSWTLPQSGPLSGGNDALPWVIFHRDRELFEQKTNWSIELIKKIMPFRYLVSGGISVRNLVPTWMFKPLTSLENSLPEPVMNKTAMFAMIVLRKS